MTTPFAITGVGLVTPVGAGAAGSCAALRAGVSAPSEIVPGGVGGGEEDTPPVMGHSTLFADGFFQNGAWTRLASIAMADLLRRARPPTDPGSWSRAAMGVLGPILTEERFTWSSEDEPRALELRVGRPLAELHGLPVPDSAIRGFTGHCALAACLAAADEAPGDRDRILVASADTYLEPLSIAWLGVDARLKTPDRPTGLMPGEAGAALLLESEHAARVRKADILGRVEAVALAAAPLQPRPQDSERAEEESPSPRPEGPKLGRAIAQAMREVLPAGRERFAGDLYLDLNGEEWRAHGWGHAQVHLARQVDFDRCRTWLPAASIGEIGAAAAPVALSLALWNFDRDGSRDALVVSAADDGRVAAIRLSAPSARPT